MVKQKTYKTCITVEKLPFA